MGRKHERESSRERGVAANAVDTFRGSTKNESSTPARRQQEKQEEKGVENSKFLNDSGPEGRDLMIEHKFIRTALLG